MDKLISLCMIVRDEEKVLARALDGVKDCVDEIVIVDTGSRDNTKRIAERYTDRIFDFEWCDDFAAARNFSFSKAEGEYILWLDADDIVTEENARLLNEFKPRLIAEKPDAVMCRYDIAFAEDGSPTYSYIRERIVRRETCPGWVGFVHECIAPHGKIAFSLFTVRHGATEGKVRGRRNLDIYQRHIAAGAKLDNRNMFYYGRELYSNNLLLEAEAVLQKAVDTESWAVNRIEASKVLADCKIALGKRDEALTTLFGSFRFGEPRAAVLCKIGTIFKEQRRYKEAIYWFTAALSAKDFSALGDFDTPESRTIIPLIELTACYWGDGDEKRALECHRTARSIRPDHPSVVYNEKFFRERGLLD